MIEKPFAVIGGLAKKVQAAATKVALKAAKVSEAMARKVASIEARAAARAQAAALRRLPSRPTVEFVREVGHGRTTLSFYRVTDQRAGTSRLVWGLNRVSPDGRRERLMTGSMAELRALRTIANRSLAKGISTQETTGRAVQPTEQARPPRSATAREVVREEKATRWYTLIYVAKVGEDGQGKGRVVRNVRDLETAKAHQARHPGLIIRESSEPLPQGREIDLKLGTGPKATKSIGEPRQDGLTQERPKLALAPPVEQQQRQKRGLAMGH